MKHFYSLLLLLAVYGTTQAQTQNKILGVVTDQEGKAVPSATVSLLHKKDSSLVKIAVTDQSGKYEFLNVSQGNYLLSVSSVGYKNRMSSGVELNTADAVIPALVLSPSSKDLSAVTVTARKPFVETKLDRTVINVDASPTSAGATAMDILEKSPGIMVDNDGNISLRGKQGVIVMMDGKPTYLSAADLATLLKNMPASALDQIEIMTNPSSKYDAEGNSGIVNIKTKKGRNNGFNGNFMIGATTSIFKPASNLYFIPKSQNSFNFNYRKNKLNFFGSYNPNYFRGRNILDINYKQIDETDGITKGYTDKETKFKFGNFNQSLKLGVDWFANKNNTFGIVASGFMFKGNPKPLTLADMSDANHNLETHLETYNNNHFTFNNFTGNVNWRHQFDSAGKELTADLDYVHYSNLNDMLLTTNVYDGAMQFTGNSMLKGHLPSQIDIYSFKSDYSKPVRNGKLEAGIKSSYVRNDNIVDYENSYNGGAWTKDQIRSNHFIYEENINAAYINLNQKFNKWTLQGGLRLENTQAKGNQITSKSTFTRDTTNLFPTAFVSYELNKKNTLTVSFGRRITRPNYRDLNPFIFFLDTLSYRQGNIYLKPQYTNNVELSHAFMGRYITTLSYNKTNDVISEIIKPKEGTEGKIGFLTPDNVASLRNIALSLTIPLKIASWWNINFSGNVYNNHYKGIYDTIAIDLSATSFMMNLTNSLTITKTLSAELSGFYRYKNLDQLTVYKPVYQMSIGLQQQVLKGKGSVRLNVRDPFAWQVFEGNNQYGYVDMHFRARPDVRQVTATFSLRFGKQNSSQQPRRRSGSSQEEQSRVGSAG